MTTRVKPTPEQLTETLADVVRELLPDAPRGSDLMSIPLQDIGLDSLSIVELVVDIEERYNVVFPDHFLARETFENIPTLADSVALILGADS